MHEAARLDHVGVVGRDLPRLIDSYRRLGFQLTEPRELLRAGSQGDSAQATGQWSCHAVFASGYLELTTLGDADGTHHLAPYLAAGAGLRIVVYATDDPAAQRADCLVRGLAVGPLAIASRPIDYGKRHGSARFEWFALAPQASPHGLVAWVRHLTPELVFQPEVQGHPNGARALCAATPFSGFDVAVADLSTARRLLEQREVRHRLRPDGTIEVDAAEAGGAVLVLR